MEWTAVEHRFRCRICRQEVTESSYLFSKYLSCTYLVSDRILGAATMIINGAYTVSALKYLLCYRVSWTARRPNQSI